MAVESVKTEPILDVAGTLARFGGDKELFVEMSGIFLEDAPHVLAQLDRAVAAREAGDIRIRSHALKGLLLGCGGVRAAHAAQVLENDGESADLHQVDAHLATLKSEFEQLVHALRQCHV